MVSTSLSYLNRIFWPEKKNYKETKNNSKANDSTIIDNYKSLQWTEHKTLILLTSFFGSVSCSKIRDLFGNEDKDDDFAVDRIWGS